jgi:hypothetical protein
MRYHVVILDSRDIDSEWGPESALIEDDNLEVCQEILQETLSGVGSETIYAYRIIDTLNNCVIQSWHK